MSDEIITQPPAPADILALSESVEFKDRQEGVVGNLANPDELKRFSHLKKREPKLYAMAGYLLEDIGAIEKWERGEGSYHSPPMATLLLEPDLHLRTSQDGFLIKVFKSISHLMEGGSGGGRIGFLGRRKG